MARFGRTGPRLQPAPGSRPRQLLRGMLGVAWEDLFRAEIDNVSVAQLDEDSGVLVPSDYEEDPDLVDNQEEAEDHLSQRTKLTSDASRVWKTTAVYEHIAEPCMRVSCPLRGATHGPASPSWLSHPDHRSAFFSRSTGLSCTRNSQEDQPKKVDAYCLSTSPSSTSGPCTSSPG